MRGSAKGFSVGTRGRESPSSRPPDRDDGTYIMYTMRGGLTRPTLANLTFGRWGGATGMGWRSQHGVATVAKKIFFGPLWPASAADRAKAGVCWSAPTRDGGGPPDALAAHPDAAARAAVLPPTPTGRSRLGPPPRRSTEIPDLARPIRRAKSSGSGGGWAAERGVALWPAPLLCGWCLLPAAVPLPPAICRSTPAVKWKSELNMGAIHLPLHTASPGRSPLARASGGPVAAAADAAFPSGSGL